MYENRLRLPSVIEQCIGSYDDDEEDEEECHTDGKLPFQV